MGSCSSSGKGQSIFGGQDIGGGGKRIADLPAKMNRMYNGNNMSLSHTVEVFEAEHGTSKSEHLIAYDDDGFVSTYLHGGKSSVGFRIDDVKGKNVIHNHPNGSTFSAADIDSLVTGQMKSITATNTGTYRYTIRATAKADGAGFLKAMGKAKSTRDITTMDGYNAAVHTWLTNNASKYGYEYVRTELKGGKK